MLSLALGKEQSLSTSLSPAPSVSCVVSPVVLLSIVEHYTRRQDNQESVCGAILGTRSEDGSILYIRNAFPIPYSDETDTEIDEAAAKSLLALHRRANAREVVLGCYSTAQEATTATARLQEWFDSDMVSTANAFFNSIHLMLDCELTGDTFGLKGFTALPVGATTASGRGRLFVPVSVQVRFHDAEKSGLEAVSQAAHARKNPTTQPPSELESVENALKQLMTTVETLSTHVDKVVQRLEENGASITPEEQKRFNAVGQALADAVGRVPNLDRNVFENLLDRHLKDLKMVAQLATLTRDQLALADRLMANVPAA
ncbi:hypothetical protein RI367_002234 [Sorochytrium milnesiophthora]